MRRSFVLTALLSLATAPGRSEQAAQAGSILGDLCAQPVGWAPPFTKVYHLRHGGAIVFVAVQHVSDLSSPTMAQLKAAFERHHPTLVLVEGASAAKSGGEAYLSYLADAARRGYADGHVGENLYAVKLAADAGVPYRGWDISPHDRYVADIGKGYAVADAIGAHLLSYRVDPFGGPATRIVQSEVDAVPHVRQPTSFDYSAWYRSRYGATYDTTAGTPCGRGVASEIARYESERRTLGLADLLSASGTPGSVVMVEAGANHWLALRDHLAGLSSRVD